jgi:hypothetical protein
VDGVIRFKPLLVPVPGPNAWIGGNAGSEEVLIAVVWEAVTGLREWASIPQPARKLNTLTITNQ